MMEMQRDPPSHIAAIAFAHAGALFALLAWWIDHGMTASPEEMDEVFHTMVWPAGSEVST